MGCCCWKDRIRGKLYCHKKMNRWIVELCNSYKQVYHILNSEWCHESKKQHEILQIEDKIKKIEYIKESFKFKQLKEKRKQYEENKTKIDDTKNIHHLINIQSP